MSNSVPEGWVESSLGNIADIRFSNVDKKSDFENEEPVKLCNYMDVYSNSKITNSLPFMQATAKDREIKKFSLLKNDVIITKDSETPDDIAVSAYVSEDLKSVVCGYHLAMLRPEQSLISGEYLNHLFGLDDIQHYFYLLANGITRFGLTTDAINNAYIIYPPLPEQKKIAAILTSVDTVIEKTQAQIDKLKDLKTGMMQELLTKGIGHTEFKDSPVGRIPVEWEVKTIGDLANVKRGASPRPIKDKKWWGGNVGWIRISDVTASSKYLNKTTQYLSSEGVSKSIQIPKGEVILSICATIGRPIIINVDACIHDGFVWFDKLNGSIDREYWYYFLASKESFLSAQRQSGTQGNLNTTIVSELICPLPPTSEQKKIASILSSIDKNVEEMQHKLLQTKSIKKALMQDLLTGKVRVKV